MPAYIIGQDDQGALVEFSGTVDETNELANTVTSFPVEESEQTRSGHVTDHVRTEPVEFSCTWVETMTPSKEGRHMAQRQNQIPIYSFIDGTVIENSITIQALSSDVSYYPTVDRWVELKDLVFKRRLVTLITSLEVYTDCIITSVSAPVREPGKVEYATRFKQIQIVQTATVAAPAPKEKRGQPKKDAGATETKPATEPAIKQWGGGSDTSTIKGVIDRGTREKWGGSFLYGTQ